MAGLAVMVRLRAVVAAPAVSRQDGRVSTRLRPLAKGRQSLQEYLRSRLIDAASAPALAELLDVVLVTADGRLAKAPGLQGRLERLQ